MSNTPCKTCRAKDNESVKRSRAFLNMKVKDDHRSKFSSLSSWKEEA